MELKIILFVLGEGRVRSPCSMCTELRFGMMKRFQK